MLSKLQSHGRKYKEFCDELEKRVQQQVTAFEEELKTKAEIRMKIARTLAAKIVLNIFWERMKTDGWKEFEKLCNRYLDMFRMIQSLWEPQSRGLDVALAQNQLLVRQWFYRKFWKQGSHIKTEFDKSQAAIVLASRLLQWSNEDRVTAHEDEKVTATLHMCALYHDIYGDTQKAIKIAKRLLKDLDKPAGLKKSACKAKVQRQIVLWEAAGF